VDALKTGAFHDAAEAFSAAIRAHPAVYFRFSSATSGEAKSLASMYTWRATALQRLGHAAAAERDCDRALEVDEARARACHACCVCTRVHLIWRHVGR
jgi:hypothetical protein